MRFLLNRLARWWLGRNVKPGLYMKFGDSPAATSLGPQGRVGRYYAMQFFEYDQHGLTSIVFRASSPEAVCARAIEHTKEDKP